MDKFFLGLVIGFFTMVIIASVHVNDIDRNAGMQECEQNLPRNEHCVLIAVPESKL